VVIGVVGTTKGKNSKFRMIAYKSQNKIVDRTPIKGTIATKGSYNYYWFSNNQSVINPKSSWEHVVAVAVEGPNQDVDLFVTALDARYPVSEDYDFSSDNLGPDSV